MKDFLILCAVLESFLLSGVLRDELEDAQP